MNSPISEMATHLAKALPARFIGSGDLGIGDWSCIARQQPSCHEHSIVTSKTSQYARWRMRKFYCTEIPSERQQSLPALPHYSQPWAHMQPSVHHSQWFPTRRQARVQAHGSGSYSNSLQSVNMGHLAACPVLASPTLVAELSAWLPPTSSSCS